MGYKPGPVDRRPCSIIDFSMPRLDWRLWFVALSIGNRGPASEDGDPLSVAPKWFRVFLRKLSSREPAVIQLLAPDKGQRALFERQPIQTSMAFYEYTFAGDSRGAHNDSNSECGL